MPVRLTYKSLVISALVLIVILAVLSQFVDWSLVIQQIRQANKPALTGGTIFLLLGYWFYAVRWRFLLENQPRLRNTYHASNAGNMANTLLPLRPGDAARILILGKLDRIPLAKVTTSIIVERWYEQIMRLAALGGAIVFGLGISVSTPSILGSALFLIASLLAIVWMTRQEEYLLRKLPPFLARLPRLTEAHARHSLENLLEGLRGMTSFRNQGLALLWSVVTWTFFWLFHYLCLIAIQPDMDLMSALSLSLASLALVPPSATTLPGIYQVSMMVPLGLVGYSESMLATYSLLMNIIEIAIVMILGIWGTMRAGITLGQLVDESIITPGEETPQTNLEID